MIRRQYSPHTYRYDRRCPFCLLPERLKPKHSLSSPIQFRPPAGWGRGSHGREFRHLTRLSMGMRASHSH